jgi:hypothetical protein
MARALRCNRWLDSASESPPPRPHAAPAISVANLTRWIWSAATDNEEAEASPARRRRSLGGTRTPMSNAVIQRVRVSNWNDVRRWLAHSAAIAG